jgi:anti-anti-sigma factor
MIETNTYTDGCVRLRAFGEFSGATAVSLRHVVVDAVGQGVMVIIDLRGVECIDAEGVSALVGTVRRARWVGGDAQVVNARPEVEATFRRAGVLDMLLGSSTTTNDAA